jgi:hypothetical protein
MKFRKALGVEVVPRIEPLQPSLIDELPLFISGRPADRRGAKRGRWQVSGQVEQHEVNAFGVNRPHRRIESVCRLLHRRGRMGCPTLCKSQGKPRARNPVEGVKAGPFLPAFGER